MTRHHVAVVACGIAVAACGDTLTDPPADTQLDAQATADAVQYAGSAAVDDLRMMLLESAGLTIGPMLVEEEGDLSISRSVTFYDSLGTEMSQFDPMLTATVHVVASVSGTRTRSGPRGTLSVSVDRDRDMTISNLLGQETERQWDGAGQSSRSRVATSDSLGTREYEMSDSVTVTAVLVPVPHGDGYPLSGTIERTVILQRTDGDDTLTRERTVLVEFNGTRYVPITINGETFTLDLETREISDA